MQKYPELFRIKSERVEKRGDKRYADKGAIKDILKGKKLVIEEKLDGSQMAVGWKGGQPYIQGRNSHIALFGDKRPQYNGAVDWAWENCVKLEKLKRYLVYGEWLKVQHYIPYTLPDWFLAFDVWNMKAKRFLPFKKKKEFLASVELHTVPILYEGKVTLDLIHDLTIEKKSIHSDEHMEGCVIKDYNNQNFIKFVTREFLDEIDEMGHWTSSHKQKLNHLISFIPFS